MMAFAMHKPSRSRGVADFYSLVALLATCLLVGCASGKSSGMSASTPAGKQVDSGYQLRGVLWRVLGTDTVPVVGANVFTEPRSDGVVTDSLGRWRIEYNLVPARYIVRAELPVEGLAARQSNLVLTTDAPILEVPLFLGVDDADWPPASLLVNRVRNTFNKAPVVVRP